MNLLDTNKISIMCLDTSGNGKTGGARLKFNLDTVNYKLNIEDITFYQWDIKNYENEDDYFNNIEASVLIALDGSWYKILEVEKFVEYQNPATRFSSNSTSRLNEALKKRTNHLNNFKFLDTITASQIKKRWADSVIKKEEIAENKEVFNEVWKNLSVHQKDALRHLLHVYYFKMKGILSEWVKTV